MGFLSAVDLGQEVRDATHAVTEHMRRNNFGEMLEQAWRRRR